MCTKQKEKPALFMGTETGALLIGRKIIALYEDDYQGFNFKHFTEKLNEVEGIAVSYKTVYSLLTAGGFYPPKEHKASKKKRAKARILANKPSICDEDLKIAISHEVDLEDAHPRKPRAKYFGEEMAPATGGSQTPKLRFTLPLITQPETS